MTTHKVATSIELGNDAVLVTVHVLEDGQVVLQDIMPAGNPLRSVATPHFESSAAPLVEVRLASEGVLKNKTSKSLIGTYLGMHLKYTSHQLKEDEGGKAKRLDVEMHDKETNVSVTAHLVIFPGVPVLRSSATVKNDGKADITVTAISSLVVGGLTRSKSWWTTHDITYATNTWFREAQWHKRSFTEIGIDELTIYGRPDNHHASLATFSVTNRGTFSTQGHLPMGFISSRENNSTWLWQVENNGSWKWEVADFKDDIYVAMGGPNGNDHDWRLRLAPGESFTSATAAIAHVLGRPDTAFGVLTDYRRRIRRHHPDLDSVPIIFNDYMNCLMGNPSEEKIMALVGPVAKAGAEYFVVDAGWYADTNDWWDDVGAWEPSAKRFPNGFDKLLDQIRAAGLKVGIWLEGEVVGIRSPVAKENKLPDDAYFQRDGQRVIEKNRYQLDFRHPAVIEHMNGVVDRLMETLRPDYFKFDYNIEVTQGTDVNCSSAGVGQLDHNRAYIAWVVGLLDRYPGLVIENCSSGAQRMDYAMLAVHSLQSTSDQQDPVKYAAIAAAIHTAVTPEQGATWAYPQPDWEDEINALTVVNSLLGRVHLSGRMDLLDSKQLDLICQGMAVAKDISRSLVTSTPFWPLGLSKWHDEWLAAGLWDTRSTLAYLAVWRRGGEQACNLPVNVIPTGQEVKAELLYPVGFEAEASWNAASHSLQVKLPARICARLYRLTWVEQIASQP